MKYEMECTLTIHIQENDHFRSYIGLFSSKEKARRMEWNRRRENSMTD